MKTFILLYIVLAALQCACLAQTPPEQPTNCQLTVGAAPPETFQGCSTVTNLDPLVPYTFYYTLTPSSTGSGTTWRGGLKVNVDAANGSWAGFGFGMQMLGSNAVILQKCTKCPSKARIDGYVLSDYDPASKKPGSFPIRDAAAAVSPDDGSLVAVFTADLPQSIEELTATPFNHISAVGPAASDGSLQPHVGTGNYPYGVFPVDLKSSSFSTTDPTAAQQNSSTPSQNAQSPTSESSTPAPAGAAPSYSFSTCDVTGHSQLAGFSTCTTLGSNVLTVHWKTPSPASSSSRSGNITLEFGLSGTIIGNEWVALGFPATPGQMIGSTAEVLISCLPGSSPKICNAEDIQRGAVIKDYYLGAKDSGSVSPPGHLAFSKTQATSDGNGNAQGRFTVSLPAAAMTNGQLNVLYAKGKCDPTTGLLQHHDTKSAASLDLASGSSTTITDTSAEAKKNAHAWLMAIGWTIILGGAVVARSFKSLGSIWFQIHRGLQVFGLICVLTAFILIFSALGGHKTVYHIHYNLGIAATTLGLAQLSALVFRPHLDSRYRRAWALGHHWIGRSAIVLSIANIYYGIINVKKVGSWVVIVYSIVFGLILGVGILKESVDYLSLPPPALIRAQFANLDEEREAVAEVKELRKPAGEAGPQQRQESDKSKAGGNGSGSDDIEQPRN